MDNKDNQIECCETQCIHRELLDIVNEKLVKSRREGKSVFYSLADEHVRTIISQGLDHIEE